MKKKILPETSAVHHPRAHSIFLGHKAQEQQVLECLSQGKMPHAWLIAGPKGVGKATLAYRIAKFLSSCKVGEEIITTLHSESSHPSVSRITQGSSGDLLVLEEEVGSAITVDEVRKIAHFLHLTSASSPYRMVMIDSVDALNINAANALLKLLEEPPAQCFFFLISHCPGGLLPTIRSRCRLLSLQPLAKEEAEQVMLAHSGGISPEIAEKLLMLAGGMPGQALSFHDSGILSYYNGLIAVLQQLPGSDTQAEYRLAELHAAKAGGPVAWEHFSLLLSRLLVLVAKIAAEVPVMGLLPEEELLVRELAVQSTLDKWLELWEKVSLLMEEATRANLDLKQVTLVVFDTIRNTLSGK